LFRRLIPTAFAFALAASAFAISTGRTGAAEPAALATASQMQLAQNELRYAAGAPTVPSAGGLVTAAQDHATYSAINGTGGHYETAGMPGYTGYAPRDRAIAAGFTATFVSEVATGASDAVAGVRSLWDAPYHRLGMIHPNSFAVGWGSAASSTGRVTVVGDIAYDFGMATVDLVRSPARGQNGVPTSWNGRESPSPVPAGTSAPYGYPIMAVWSGGRGVDLRGAALSSNGVAIPFYVAPQEFERDYIVIVPQKPLPAAKIDVRFDVTVAGRWLTEEWSFTTAGASAVVPTPPTSFHSQWVTESPWPTIAIGDTTTLSVTFRNAGATTWTKGSAYEARLGVNGDDRTISSLGMTVGWPIPDRPAVQDLAVVPTGASTTFSFSIRGTRVGTYWIHLRPVVDGVTWMEDEGVYMVVTVR
jgi:uncharacterized protein YkwD